MIGGHGAGDAGGEDVGGADGETVFIGKEMVIMAINSAEAPGVGEMGSCRFFRRR